MSQNNNVSRESSRVEEAKNAPKNRELVLANSQTAQKHELVTLVMEARLSRLQNYKLTGDSSMWDKSEYTKRTQEIQKFLEAIQGKTSDADIIAASSVLSMKDGALVRNELLKQNASVGDVQKIAIRLIRADNGSDQIEAIAAKDLGALVESGITKLNADSDALTKIKQRTQKHFGEMMTQGVFLNATPDVKAAAEAGLESMYQMRYIAKEYIDEKGGIAVPDALKHTWENYRDSMDIKDAWFTMSDAGSTQLASFLLYDLAPMIVSGGVAGVAGKVAIKAGAKATAMLASRMPAAVKYVNSGTRAANTIKNTATLAGKATVATAEAVTFDATFEGLRNQRLFTDKPHWQQDLIKNAAGFGFSRYLAGATKFGKLNLDPLSHQLIKQGLIVPAIITGVGVGQKLLANDPDVYHGALEEFILGAIMIGAFHTSGKILQARSGAKDTGISKVEPTPDGQNVAITTPDGQKLVTRMTDKIRNAIQDLRKKDTPVATNPQGVDMAHGARLEPVSNNTVAVVPKNGKGVKVETPIAEKTTKTAKLVSEKKGPYRNEERINKLEETKRALENELQIKQTNLENQKNTLPQNEPDIFIKKSDKIAIEQNLLLPTTLQEIEGQIGNFMKTHRIENRTQFDVNLTALQKQERIVRLRNMKGEPGNVRHEIEHQNTLTELNKYKEIQALLRKQDLHKIYLQRHYESNPIVQDFFASKRISNWSEFDTNLAALKKQERIARLRDMKGEPGNGRHELNHQNTLTELNKYKEINSLVPGRAQSDISHNMNNSQSTGTQNINDIQAKIQKIDDMIGRENSRGVRPLSKDAESPVQDTSKAPTEISPLRQSRLEAREYLRTERAEFHALSPEVRANHLDGVKLEGKQLAGRKGDLENKLIFTEKRTPSETEQIKKDIAEIDKKIMANKRQQNMMEKGNKIINDAEVGLIAAGVEPAKIVKEVETPEGRKQLAKELDSLKQKDYKKWLLLVPLILLLLFGMKKCSESEDPKTDTVKPPEHDPSKPIGPQIDAACGVDSGKNKSTITVRSNGSGMQLTESRRESISSKWMKTKDWKDLVKLFEGQKNTFTNTKFAEVFDTMLKEPTIKNVQEIQRWIGMEPEDNKTAQDGILGPITTQAIRSFMSKCTPTTIALNVPIISTNEEALSA